jgi:uncharacterized membrane protein SirB2
MNEYYLQIRVAHVLFVCCSGALFATRGLLAIAGKSWGNHLALRRLSYTIDTGLLLAALMLVAISHQYPFVQPWLTTKVLLLVVYIVLGIYALRRARTQAVRVAAYVAALLVFLFIASVAWRHDPRGIFADYCGRHSAASAPGVPALPSAWISRQLSASCAANGPFPADARAGASTAVASAMQPRRASSSARLLRAGR